MADTGEPSARESLVISRGPGVEIVGNVGMHKTSGRLFCDRGHVDRIIADHVPNLVERAQRLRIVVELID